MPRKRVSPTFSGPLAKPIYEPIVGGVLAFPHDEEVRRKRIVAEWVTKLQLLPDHYGIDRSDPKLWELTCLYLALDFVPGMQIVASPPPKPGRKRTWQAGLGDDLVRAVQERLTAKPSRVGVALDDLRASDPRWRCFPRQTLGARFRDAKRAQRHRREEIAKLMAGDGGFLSLATLKSEYDARSARLGGLFGLGEPSLATSGQSDENGGS
jgi:hypothetical protein